MVIVIRGNLEKTSKIIKELHGRIAAYGTPAEVRASPDDHVQHFIHAGSV